MFRFYRFAIAFMILLLPSCTRMAIIDGIPPIYNLNEAEIGKTEPLEVTLKDNPRCLTKNLSTPHRYSLTILELEVKNNSQNNINFNPEKISRTIGLVTESYSLNKNIKSNNEIWGESTLIQPGQAISKELIFVENKCPYGSMKLSINGIDYVYSQKSPYLSGPFEMLLGITWPLRMLLFGP